MSTIASQKRKLSSQKSALPRKKIKVRYDKADELPWKTISRPLDIGYSGDDGIIDLEEVDDVEVVYEETDAGRLVKFNVIQTEHDKDDREAKEEAASSSESEEDESNSFPPDIGFDASSLPDWEPFGLNPQLLKSLLSRQFSSPTPIQAKVLPIALGQKDVIGIAETGSGKTLAYGLPILHKLLLERTRAPKKRHLSTLILTPTRELALQVSSHLKACLNSEGENSPLDGKGPNPSAQKNSSPLVSIGTIVGGMSLQKQQRILSRGTDILVATPGRLWDIIQSDDGLATQIKSLRFLVLDEADRMVESGHFAEMENILTLTRRQSDDDAIEGDTPEATGNQKSPDKNAELQTYIFSATMSKDLQRNVKRKSRPKSLQKKVNSSTLDDLLLRLDFRDSDPEVIDLSPQGGMVSTLTESRIECLPADKDAYLYYFLLRYPGRSLVFLSSIDGIRRLHPLLELLDLPVFPLHSQLEQRQRLKNLDRFKSQPNSILLATDIAARGLDIPSVDHVIHFQTPRSADTYIHRTGRTARASRTGFSLLLCAPDEKRMVRALLGSLKRKEDDIPEMEIELHLMDKLKSRIQLARQIDQAQHKVRKTNHERSWIKEAAEAMELELGSDFDSGSDEDNPTKRQRKSLNAKTAKLKAELKALLSKPLVAPGVSTKYITSGGRLDIGNIISGEYNEAMLGVKKVDAQEGAVSRRKKKKMSAQKNDVKQEVDKIGTADS